MNFNQTLPTWKMGLVTLERHLGFVRPGRSPAVQHVHRFVLTYSGFTATGYTKISGYFRSDLMCVHQE